MEKPVRRSRRAASPSATPGTAPKVPVSAVPRTPDGPVLSLVATEPPPATEAPAPPEVRRPRGRPRKTADELDDGNRRRKLIEGAARLFRTKGFDAASTRDIAAAAGMHSGSPFYHFESKSALLYAVMDEGMVLAAHSQANALALLPAQATPRERLRVLVRHHFEILLGPHSDFIPVMLYEWRSLSGPQRKGIARVKDAYEAAWMPVLQALAAQGLLQAEPGVARLFIFGALNWSVQWFDAKRGLSLDQLTEQALALFIREAP
ncbi:TetR/AcrR family transcriptional regulator [Curvibacter sp. RS43]|uniref:TetR/AcrR family transcriptional regulator n=1 Tax=Curvibacter microcysteis TaxID=3026419 RepID=A0ABT5M969_9BURK|nr:MULTISPECIES: TetR/AcrR family transcriptional regulator [unclassified Curvibacter]MDD0812164.1 TetR/AcrR family transcriptional regulator [Curvibacter sp. RS43]MDD0813128.1 TetR/AcrR family transcriptional regulator [Curvibacter sp. HBC28]